jgi:hypothetical protein
MSATDMNKPSTTNWDRVDALSDAEIDTSDIPPLDEAFFARATLRRPATAARQPTAGLAEQAILAHAAEGVPTEGIRRLLDAGVSGEQIAAGIQAAITRYLADELAHV